MLQPQAVELEVLAGGEGGFVLPFQLHAQHHDDVGVADRFADVVGEADAGRDAGQLAAAAATPGRRARCAAPNFESR